MEDVVVRPKPARMGAREGSRLGVNGGSHAISKSPPAAPKIRIIHLFAPEIIQTDAANFRALVQRLTGKQAIGGNVDNNRRGSRRSKSKKAQSVRPQQAPPAAHVEPAVAALARQQSSGGAETSDSGRYGSEEVGGTGPFGPAVGRPVKEEGEVLEGMWFGGSYAGGASSCSGSDVGTVSAEFGGFVDLDEFVQGLYDYPHDASMGCSTVYADLFGESPVSGSC